VIASARELCLHLATDHVPCCLSLLCAHSLVVTGHSGGQVRFFDSELKLLNWYEHTPKFGPLASVSFAYTPKLKDLRDG